MVQILACRLKPGEAISSFSSSASCTNESDCSAQVNAPEEAEAGVVAAMFLGVSKFQIFSLNPCESRIVVGLGKFHGTPWRLDFKTF